MAEEKDLQRAKTVYEALCGNLDGHKWRYKKNEDELSIECGAQGDDLPMELTIQVDADRQLILLLSHLPFVISEDKRLDLAVAVSVANSRIVDGCFDYDVRTGHMFFRMTNSFIESEIGDDAFSYMMYCSCRTIDDFNDKFLMLAKNMMSLEQFISDNT